MECSFEGCAKVIVNKKRSLCTGHYAQVMRGAPLTPLIIRIPAQHGSIGKYNNHKCRCELCVSAWNEYCAEYKRRVRQEARGAGTYKERFPDFGLNERLKKTLRVELGLDERAGGCCEICGRKSDKLVVDHIHGTEIIRGLLCHSCNTGLGKLGDNMEGLEAAMRYVRLNTPQ